MPMQMGFRWYGEGNDKVPLSYIRQIPGVSTIVWGLHHKMPGEVWQQEEIAEVQKQLEPYGFNMDVVESVNIHDDIKIGLPTRDKYIDNYIQTIRNLAPFGVKVICYNFMPVLDWMRTDLFHPLPDGSTALFYEADKIVDDPRQMADYFLKKQEESGMTFPGWEPERIAHLEELFRAYKDVTKEKLWENLKYFLERLMPVCHECDVKMAIHTDDPPWDIFGLPRLMVSEEAVDHFLHMVDDPYNCLTLCSGSLNSNPENIVADIVRKHCDRIAFAHIRNVKHYDNGNFSEVSHRDCDGDTGIIDILRAYHDCGFQGYIRPDHGRHIWGEGPQNCRPGYGLYDRALGIMYMLGVWDSMEKEKKMIYLDPKADLPFKNCRTKLNGKQKAIVFPHLTVPLWWKQQKPIPPGYTSGQATSSKPFRRMPVSGFWMPESSKPVLLLRNAGRKSRKQTTISPSR